MLILNVNEHHEMKHLMSLMGDGSDSKGFISWVLHSGEFTGKYPNLSKLHRYDVIGAALTGQYQLRATPKEIYQKHLNEAKKHDLDGSNHTLSWALQRFYNDLKTNGFIKEEN
jgi:hypothetical protein